MGLALTRDQVLALAPDAASAKAATGLVADSKWVSLGADAEAAWGECQGSGTKPYQSQVDLVALVARCSCPSRKFPCKHGLALLLLYAQGNTRFGNATRPAWVDEWLASRRDKASKREQAIETAAARAEAEPEATAASAARRESARWKRIEAGSVDLQRWIADQFRRGLAKFGPEQRVEGLAMAARMVDAQAPGLGQQLRVALDAMASGMGRMPEAIERLGLLQLLNEGVQRRARLGPARLADVRSALGWPLDKDDVLRDGEAVTDLWRVLGQCVVDLDGKLSERRVWLQGLGTQRHALLQDFAYAGKAWDGTWRNHACYVAALRYFPGSVALRAVAHEVVVDSARPPWSPINNAQGIDYLSKAHAANPWLTQLPLLLDKAILVPQEGAWQLHCDAGVFLLQLGHDSAWSLLALSGGHPLQVMGEWDGRRLRPLSASSDEGVRWALEAAA